MSNPITTIESSLQSILQNVSELNSVLTYEPLTIPKPPCATICFLGFDAERAEVESLLNSYMFRIRLYFDLIDAERAATQMKNTVWSVIEQLKANTSLGNSCSYSEITRGEAVYIELVNRDRPLEGFEIELAAIRQEH